MLAALPFLILLTAFWAGLMSGNAVMAAGHVLMLPCVAVVMLRRRGEYALEHRRPSPEVQDISSAR